MEQGVHRKVRYLGSPMMVGATVGGSSRVWRSTTRSDQYRASRRACVGGSGGRTESVGGTVGGNSGSSTGGSTAWDLISVPAVA
eukprot:3545038-Rhodomonas_salina.4